MSRKEAGSPTVKAMEDALNRWEVGQESGKTIHYAVVHGGCRNEIIHRFGGEANSAATYRKGNAWGSAGCRIRGEPRSGLLDRGKIRIL